MAQNELPVLDWTLDALSHASWFMHAHTAIDKAIAELVARGYSGTLWFPYGIVRIERDPYDVRGGLDVGTTTPL